jgi:flagellar assembly protein FliH
MIPAERLSAWERWELGSLAATSAPTKEELDRKAAEALAAERLQIVADARAEGHAQGYAAGMARAEAERTRLAALVGVLEQCAADHEQRLVDEVLDLAVLLARQIVGESLVVNREFLQTIVAEALWQLPQSTQRIDLHVHPHDLAIVENHLEQDPLRSRCHFVADQTITPGGCRIETPETEIDATLELRWKRLMAALGRSAEWIKHA